MEPAQAQPGLAEVLLELGLVNEAQLDRARRVARHLARPRPLPELLVELGTIARSDLDRALQLYRSRQSVADILRDEGILDAEKYAAYEIARAANPARSERDILLGDKLVTEAEYLRALAAKLDIPLVEPEASLLDPKLLSRVSIPYLLRHRLIPFRLLDGTLSVLTPRPEEPEQLKEIEQIYGVPARPCAATSAAIIHALQAFERMREQGEEASQPLLQYREIREDPEADHESEGAVRIVDYLISKAIDLGASDLHIEPAHNRVRVRARVDGVLRPVTELPADFTPRLVSRVKILSGADIAERRLHQDGRIFVKAKGRELDIRVSFYASMFGETVVMRLLDRSRGLLPLEKLGFTANALTLLREVVLRASSGLVLITGPTGSGKTTTLYSFVDYMKDDSIKIITCEDPVEYVLEQVTQCSVNEKTGPTFADSLRAIVRQDPDVIVVGEIRDSLTARLAVQAALTGHKVLSTFHTEDAVGAVTRLTEMGVEPFLLASTLTCVIAQRLVRRLCPECKRRAQPARRDLRFLGLTQEQLRGVELFEGGGCEACGQAGYRGRIGIHEVLYPDEEFRDAILARTPSSQLRTLARRLPRYLTLQEDGLLKAIEGTTSLAEVADNVPRDAGCRPLQQLRQIASSRRNR